MHNQVEFDAVLSAHGGLEYLGLAPFLRASIAGADLRTHTQRMLELLPGEGGNANLLMNLSVAFQCLHQQALGLEFQREALALQRTYVVPARLQPARMRLLVLVSEGSIQSNTPLDCLLEVSDIELVFHFLCAGESLPDLPAHDLLFVGISDSDANRPMLRELEMALAQWPCPVLNHPQYLPLTGRDEASRLLQDVAGLLAPATARASRSQLEGVACGAERLADVIPDGAFPVIVRPLGSQAGLDLERIDEARALGAYLAQLAEEQFFVAPFIDYSDGAGHYRKARIALIDGQPFVCHMAVSSHWMIHYVNAGMYDEAWKRADEARFMADFEAFVVRHRSALAEISRRMQLDYLVMDCAETRTGELLLFEIDHGGVVHAMDVEALFPYKNDHIRKARDAFCAMLDARQHPRQTNGTEP